MGDAVDARPQWPPWPQFEARRPREGKGGTACSSPLLLTSAFIDPWKAARVVDAPARWSRRRASEMRLTTSRGGSPRDDHRRHDR
jgi:hypothetical protein